MAGYVGFGSFHGENVEEMIAAAADESFEEAPLPSPALQPAGLLASIGCVDDTCIPPFGAQFKLQFFLDPSWTFVNHGAFGAACRASVSATHAWQEHCERQPLEFIDRQLFSQLVTSTRQAARLLRAPCTHVAIIQNATYGLNCAIAAANLQRADVAFMLDIGYGSVKKMLTTVCAARGAALVVHAVRFPLVGPDDLLSQAAAAMAAAASDAVGCGRRLSLAVFDHVTSNSGLVLPVAGLTAAAHALGARVLIDGAHALQQLVTPSARCGDSSRSDGTSGAASTADDAPGDLDVPALGCEWYVTNAHKWACSAKGVALLYAAPGVRDATRPLVISHGYGAGFTSDFMWDGCRDYAGALALPALLAWWRLVGPAAARAYCESLLQRAVSLLECAWGTRAHGPRSMYSHMACVELPPRALPPGALLLPGCGSSGAEDASSATGSGAPLEDASSATGSGASAPRYAVTSAHAKAVQDALHFRHRIEAPVKVLPAAGTAGDVSALRLYVRISAAPYNELADYQRLADAVTGLRWAANGREVSPGRTEQACTTTPCAPAS